MRKTFSLTELIIVIVVVAILTAFLIPGFRQGRENALNREARAMLKLVQAAEKMYRLEIGWYVPCADTAACNTQLNLDLTDNVPNEWDYNVTSDDRTSSDGEFEAGASGPTDDTWCINEVMDEADGTCVRP